MFRTSAVVDLTNLVVVISGAALGISYLVSPDLRRTLEINVFHRSAWYYVGKYVERPDGEYAPGGWENELDGCERSEVNFYYVGWDESVPFPTEMLFELPGKILVSLDDRRTAGRRGDIDDDRFSDNEIVALSQPGQCYYVRQVAERPLGPAKGCDGVERESIAYWAEAVRITCD